MSRRLYEQEVLRTVLSLYEVLVRHDENIKAHTLMTECVPYFLNNVVVVEEMKDRITQMTAHLRNPREYDEYYGNNPHEKPFEQMFGLTVDQADQFERVAWFKEKQKQRNHRSLLDFACNDGAILRHLLDHTTIETVMGVDLNPNCVDRAKGRGINARKCSAYDAVGEYDAVLVFELIEHVPDPVTLLEAAANCARYVYVSTPHGASAMGEIGEWNKVEYKGHVRAVVPQDIERWADQAGLDVLSVELGSIDNVILAELRRDWA